MLNILYLFPTNSNIRSNNFNKAVCISSHSDSSFTVWQLYSANRFKCRAPHSEFYLIHAIFLLLRCPFTEVNT